MLAKFWIYNVLCVQYICIIYIQPQQKSISNSKHNCSILFYTCNSLFYIQWFYTYINLAQLEVPLFIIPQQNCNACSSISLTALEFHFGLMATTAWKVIIPDLPGLSCELKARDPYIVPPPLDLSLPFIWGAIRDI